MQEMDGKLDRMIVGRTFWRAAIIVVVIVALALIALAVLFARMGLIAGPKRVTEIPATFPKNFTLFRPERISDIYYYPASAKRGIASFALAPIRMIAGSKSSLPEALDAGVKAATARDTVSFVWSNLDTTTDEILRFYAGSFKEVGLLNPYVRMLEDKSAFEMVATSTIVSASLVVVDRPETPSLDTATLVVEYPLLQTR